MEQEGGGPDTLDDGFGAFYRDARPRVARALTVASGRADLAADATDEAFVRAFERWRRVGAMASPDRWVITVGLNVIRKGERSSARRRDRELRVAGPVRSLPDDGPSPEVWAAVRSLPDRQREAVALRYFADLTEAAVAEALGIRPGTVARLLHDARASLAARLSPAERDAEEQHHG